jgi:DDE superfamily endonuclease
LLKTWCIPPKADAAFVYHMEDVLQTYHRPYDPRFPVVCMDEASKQLIAEIAVPLPTTSGHAKRVDYEYARKGVCNQFVLCAPLRGWRHVKVTQRRTKRDWAWCIRELLEVYYPEAVTLRLVLDNLNTHTGAALYDTFAPDKARRLLERLEFHYTPKHASWLNMAEIEIGVLSRQCLNRRIDNAQTMAEEIAAWETKRNADGVKLHWTFTISVARAKLRKLYPSIED